MKTGLRKKTGSYYNGKSQWIDQRYRLIWVNMIKQAIDFSKEKPVSEEFFKTHVGWLLQEVFLSRCYIMSNLFTEDCYFLDWNDDQIRTARNKCLEMWRGGKSSCLICKKRNRGKEKYLEGYYLCWDHWKAIQEYGKGREPELKLLRDDLKVEKDIKYLLQPKQPKPKTKRGKGKSHSISFEKKVELIKKYFSGYTGETKITQGTLANEYGISQGQVSIIIKNSSQYIGKENKCFTQS